MSPLLPFLEPAQALPADAGRALLVGRARTEDGPVLVGVHGDQLVDITDLGPTMADLCARDELAADVRAALHTAMPVAPVADVLMASAAGGQALPRLLAPIDLQAVKACGVTFVRSMLERVIEEQARGDSGRAEEIRRTVTGLIGSDLSGIVPGSPEALALRAALIEKGAWSQYLEVGIGVDAEVFTKCQPMAAVGTGAAIGIRADSSWNNPEPELVLVIAPGGRIIGATLGNDVNLRDIEGRSALLLGQAKDNNGSTAIGPFIRLLDDSLGGGYGLDRLRRTDISLTVAGTDGYRLEGRSSVGEISRDLTELAAHATGPTHPYPDGLVLFTGTMFAPTDDRDTPGGGFTHKHGDVVAISSPDLGCLVNRVGDCAEIPPWTEGTRALMRNLAGRGLLAG